MTRDVGKFGTSDKRGRAATHDDPYAPESGLKGTLLCKDCHALYRNKSWLLDAKAYQESKQGGDFEWTTCPACQKIAQHFAEGIFTLSGKYLWDHEEEIRNILKNEEQRAMAQNPLERIMRMEREGDKLIVETTEEKLAEHLGRAVHRAHQGKLKVTWTGDPATCRVTWQRLT
ncbi:hypothetical protein EDC39_103184 [Geothermobacter ehrlichii]|uniref:NMD3 family protein n=1 Tax=Geothermobacter ehrlichii TaxID=213224 RepID=A0A5D3WPK6_9BACT|nr:BCAM0308 family protein [Geothermobacter ehrlichii]TYO99338.1 hypothetical protein EDC39_103184 [Geothermobacter ehrlichii]